MPASARPRAPTVAVLHLARKANGPDAVRRFLASYLEHDAGMPHELVVIAKGYQSARELDEPLAEAGARVRRVLAMSDQGFDLTAYLKAARLVDHDLLCYLNSFSRVLADGWLAHLITSLTRPNVGLVGATGSWASMVSYLVYQLGLPSAYGSAYSDRRATRAALTQLEGGDAQALGPLRERAATALALGRHLGGFPLRYPAPHVRTNTFAIAAENMRAIRPGALQDKRQAHRLESGRHSLTHQVIDMGLQVRVVGADGGTFAPGEWPESATLWQRRQENLLVADNQTDLYASGDIDRRTALSRYAWADRAQPLGG